MHRNERLKPIFQEMDPGLYNDIRGNYYKAAEGLSRLNDLLAEASNIQEGLAGEMQKSQRALVAFGALDLGDVL